MFTLSYQQLQLFLSLLMQLYEIKPLKQEMDLQNHLKKSNKKGTCQKAFNSLTFTGQKRHIKSTRQCYIQIETDISLVCTSATGNKDHVGDTLGLRMSLKSKNQPTQLHCMLRKKITIEIMPKLQNERQREGTKNRKKMVRKSSNREEHEKLGRVLLVHSACDSLHGSPQSKSDILIPEAINERVQHWHPKSIKH